MHDSRKKCFFGRYSEIDGPSSGRKKIRDEENISTRMKNIF